MQKQIVRQLERKVLITILATERGTETTKWKSVARVHNQRLLLRQDQQIEPR